MAAPRKYTSPNSTPSPPSMASLQKELFRILAELFRRATGTTPEKFATFDTFGDVISSNARKLTSRIPNGLDYASSELFNFYNTYSRVIFSEAKRIEGMNLVLGGSSRFLGSQLGAVRKTILYADTILIPDPVYPWMEAPRTEERFNIVAFIENVFGLLHLKPLVDADLPYPAILVFPSFEKSLEDRDPVTQQGITTLALGILSRALSRDFISLEDLQSYAETNEAKFMEAIDKNRLFVAPGGEVGEPLNKSITRYRAFLNQWRSEEYLKLMGNLPDRDLVINGLFERIGPQYHLLENASELSSSPLVCLPAHWHYYGLASRYFEARLKAAGLLEPSTIATVKAINQPNLKWLGNVPIQQLAQLRRNRENEDFRRRLKESISDLHSASLGDLNRIAAQVSRAIASLLSEHEKQLCEIRGRYKLKYGNLATGAWIAAAAQLVPALAPFVGITAPLMLAGTYSATKLSERKDLHKLSRSLMGVLAAANTP